MGKNVVIICVLVLLCLAVAMATPERIGVALENTTQHNTTILNESIVFNTTNQSNVSIPEPREKKVIEKKPLPVEPKEKYLVKYAGNSRNARSMQASTVAGGYQEVELTETELQDLRAQGLVAGVQKVERVQTFLSSINPLTGVNKLLEYTTQDAYIANGTGITACIIDTGINATHQYIPSSTIIHEECFVDDLNLSDSTGWCPNGQRTDTNAEDDHGHGTFIAGIFVSNSSVHQGVSPGIKLVIVKALAYDGTGWNTDVIKGIDFCVANKDTYNISIITMSLGSSGYNTTSSCESANGAYTASINAAVAANITVFAASGNCYSGGAGCAATYNNNELAVPACIGNAISVGATDDNDAMAYFSQRGPLLDFVAPGHPMTSLNYQGGFSTLSGTSFSTPYVAAVAANIISSWKIMTGTELTNTQVRSELEQTTIAIVDGSTTYERINILPIINLDQPNDNEIFTTSEINISYNAYFQKSLFTQNSSLQTTINCSLYLNSQLNDTQLAIHNQTNYFNITNIPSGEYDYYVSCNDFANNRANTTTKSFSVSTDPIISIVSPNNNSIIITENFSYQYSVTHLANLTFCATYINNSLYQNKTTNLTSPITINITNQNNTISVRTTCSDILGNTGNSSEYYYTIDPNPANITINSPTNMSWSNTNPTILNYTVQDEVGADWCAVYVNNIKISNTTSVDTNTTATTSTAKSSGNHSWFVSCADGLGSRVVNSSVYYFAVDIQKPSTTLSGFTPGDVTNNTVTFTLSTTQYGSSPANGTYYKINDGSFQLYTQAVNITAPGTHTVSYYAVDEAQNTETIKSATVTIYQTAPYFTLTSPITTASYTTIPFIVNTSQASNISFSLNGTTVLEFVNQSTVNASITGIENGNYSYVITFTNSLGYTNSSSGWLLVQSDAPLVTFNQTPRNNYYTGTLLVRYFANASNTSQGVVQVFNGTSFVNTTTQTLSSNANITYRSLINNVTSSNYTLNLSFDSTAPSTTLFTRKNIYKTGETITVQVQASDSQSGIASVQATLGATTKTLQEHAGVYTTTFTAGSQGTYVLSATSTDIVGNTQQVIKNITVTTLQEEDINTFYEAGQAQTSNFTSTLNALITLLTNSTSTENFSVSRFSSRPPYVATNLGNASDYYTFNFTDETIINWTYIRVYYDMNDFPGFDESSFSLYYYNESSTAWIELSPSLSFVNAVGQDTTNNFLWANLSHFSTYSYTGEGIACSSVLNSANRTTSDCYYQGTFVDSGDYICPGGVQSTVCYETVSEESGGAGGGAGGAATETTTTELAITTDDEPTTTTDTTSASTTTDTTTVPNRNTATQTDNTTNTTESEENDEPKTITKSPRDHFAVPTWVYIVFPVLLVLGLGGRGFILYRRKKQWEAYYAHQAEQRRKRAAKKRRDAKKAATKKTSKAPVRKTTVRKKATTTKKAAKKKSSRR